MTALGPPDPAMPPVAAMSDETPVAALDAALAAMPPVAAASDETPVAALDAALAAMPPVAAMSDETPVAALDAALAALPTSPAPATPAEDVDELVRPFLITGGRVRTEVPEVAIETVVCARSDAVSHRQHLRREERRVLDALRGPMSVAEVSAHLTIPLRAAVILVSELVAAGIIVAGRNADTGDTDFLMEIRSALQLL